MEPIILNEKWRVALAPHPNQWVLQIKHVSSWEGKSYCQTKAALLTAVKEKVARAGEYYPGAHSMTVDPAAMAALEALPDRCPQENAPNTEA